MIASVCSSLINIPHTSKLHSAKTNWKTYRRIVEENINLQTRLKHLSDIDSAIDFFNKILHDAAFVITAIMKDMKYQSTSFEIKKMIDKKRKARETWHTSHLPSNRNILNNLRNKLKLKARLKELNNTNFTDYFTSLNRSISRPIENNLKPCSRNPPVRWESK